MRTLYKHSEVYIDGKIQKADLAVRDDIIVSIRDSLVPDGDNLCDLSDLFIFPGLIDVHTHLREPGFFYKESIKTGSSAAAASGYTDICAMPNLDPVPDDVETMERELEIIRKDAVIRVYPYAALTKGEKGAEAVDYAALKGSAIAFSDDGRGVQDDEMMEKIMKKAARAGVLVAAHCEYDSLRNGGYIHAGRYALEHGHKGISSESEFAMIERDLRLAEKTGCKYHVCHISTAQSVDLIRKAKRRGVDVTCETAPHYLVLDESDLKEDGRFKMNPPLRSKEDRLALLEGIKDGTIDMIATDHAPHSSEEKSRGLEGSAMGVSGLEAAFPILYTELVRTKTITLEKLIEIMSDAPRKRFGIGTALKEGGKADFAVFDLNRKYTIEGDKFLSKGKITPFEGREVYGKCIMTVIGGKKVWTENSIKK